MTLILIDASGWIHASYHRMPHLQTSDGTPTGAVYGFTQMLWRFIKSPPAPFSHIAAVFDHGGPTWRADLDPAYKANRRRKPDALTWQGGRLRRAANVLGVTPIEAAGYEADDLIATYTRRAKAAGMNVVIVSADKDLMQLVDEPRVRLWNSHPRSGVMREGTQRISHAGRWVTEKDVLAHFGVEPRRIPDVQGMAGDTSDGYAGIPSFGYVIASNLIQRFCTLENVISEAGKGVGSLITEPRKRALILEHADRARVCKRLATLDPVADCFVTLDELVIRTPDEEAVQAFLAEHQMSEFAGRFTRELPGVLQQREEAIA